MKIRISNDPIMIYDRVQMHLFVWRWFTISARCRHTHPSNRIQTNCIVISVEKNVPKSIRKTSVSDLQWRRKWRLQRRQQRRQWSYTRVTIRRWYEWALLCGMLDACHSRIHTNACTTHYTRPSSLSTQRMWTEKRWKIANKLCHWHLRLLQHWPAVVGTNQISAMRFLFKRCRQLLFFYYFINVSSSLYRNTIGSVMSRHSERFM